MLSSSPVSWAPVGCTRESDGSNAAGRGGCGFHYTELPCGRGKGSMRLHISDKAEPRGGWDGV